MSDQKVTDQPAVRRSVARTFKLVREKFEVTGDWFFICTVLNELCESQAIDWKTKAICKMVINRRLDGASTYQAWIQANHPDLYWEVVQNHEIPKLQYEGRLLWLDSLIEEFSK